MLLLMLVACPGTQEDSGPPPVTDSCLPIEAGYANVEPILIEACGDCHGTEPRYGAPYSLVDGYADLVAGPPGERKTDAMLDSLMAGTMPQGSTLEHNALDTLVEWTSCGEEHAVHGPDLEANRPIWEAPPEPPEGTEALDLLVPEQTIDVDDIDDYRDFTFSNLVDQDMVIHRIEPVIDEDRVLHHITLAQDAGFPYLYAWAPGTGPIQFPDGGMVLRPGDELALQLHYNNGAGLENAKDTSGVRLWISAEADVLYGMMSPSTWDMVVPPGEYREFTQTCTVSQDFEIVAGLPHMHEIGSTFKHVLTRNDGTQESLIELTGWDFERQYFYEIPVSVKSGDTLTMTCGYQNTTDQTVYAGLGTADEMCFDFLVVTPAAAQAQCAW